MSISSVVQQYLLFSNYQRRDSVNLKKSARELTLKRNHLIVVKVYTYCTAISLIEHEKESLYLKSVL